MHLLLRIVIKEFLQLRQDRKMLPIVLVSPIVQLVIFGFAVNTDVRDVPLLLVDRDRTAASRALVERFLASGHFVLAGSEDEVRAVDGWLLAGRAELALVLGEGYSRALDSGRAAPIQVIGDGSDAASARVTLGHAAAVIAAGGGSSAAPAPLPGGVRLVPRVLYNPGLESRWFYVPAVLAMILMVMTLLLSAMAIVREKEIGTLEQVLVTPIRPWQLVFGKLLPFALIGLVQVPLVTGVAVWGFGVPLRGSFPLLLALTLLFLLNTLGLGLLVSTLVRTQQQAMLVSAFGAMVPMIYLSGLIFPIENMPRLIQLATYAIPLRYYATVIRGVFLKGSGLGVLWPEAVVLAGTGTLIFAAAALRFRKRLD